MYETSPTPWWICVVGIRAKDNPKNNTLHRATAYLSGHTIFIQMRVNSLHLQKRSPGAVTNKDAIQDAKGKKIRKKAQQR